MRYPVSFSQRRLWFLDQLEPGTPSYNMPYKIWLDGTLDVTAFQAAVNALAARHAVLRTSIVAFDGVPEQIVDDTGVRVELIELPAGLDDAERTSQAEAIAVARARQPFELAAGPLIRITLVRTRPARHLFVLVLHHIISDGVSMQLVFDELSVLYLAQAAGAPASLPPLVMEYADYAVWQQDRMRGEELERQLSYWREHLRGAPQIMTLPTDRPRPPRQSSAGAVGQVNLDAQTSRRLGEVAAGVNATMFMLYLTGFAAVLARYAGQDDLMIGTQVAGRTHAELEPIIGMFTNTVPLRITASGNPTFSELLAAVRDVTVEALTHQELPFEKLVEEFVPERTLAHAPLIQVQFVYGSLTPPQLHLPGISEDAGVLLTETAKLDLSLYADGGEGEGATFALEYSTDLFDAPWAQRFLSCMVHLLHSAADAPDTPVADLPMLSAAEIDELVIGRDRPSSAAGDDGETDVRRVLQESTSRVADSLGALPMSEVRRRAARIARVLAERGAGPETLVGLCTGRGIGMLSALLGVWWAGAAYVPLDPRFPQARLAAMVRGAGLRTVISDDACRELAASIAPGAEVICVEDPAVAAAEPLPPVPVPGTALAYVIFTSGSTGQPKGVGVEHRAVSNLVASFGRAIEVGGADRFIAVTTLSFDIAILELLLPLAKGAELVIASSDEAREPDRLRDLIERTGATAMQATPQTWRLLESAGGVPAGLRVRMCGGESLPAELAKQLMAPGATLWNLYGPTETTVWSAAGVVSSAASSATIGAPIEHTRSYVLDEHLMPVPVGVVGEVCLAGRGVARGYHDWPLLTARSFRPDPWSDEPGARLYRTGDLGRWLEDGGLELIGRNDHQVKIRGFRIECGEIEAVLRAHRDVRQAAVVAADRAGELVLVGYIVPRRSSVLAKPGADVLEELRPQLRAALPDYMIPALLVPLPALPLTPNAKVDRAALPAPEWGVPRSAAPIVAPRNPVEQTLAAIWGELLASDAPIGVHDNLFALGGHSLTATRFVARVDDAYGVSLPVHLIFAGPTIAELAAKITANPDFGRSSEAARARNLSFQATLDALSDEDLDELLQAALDQRNRRQAAMGDTES